MAVVLVSRLSVGQGWAFTLDISSIHHRSNRERERQANIHADTSCVSINPRTEQHLNVAVKKKTKKNWQW